MNKIFLYLVLFLISCSAYAQEEIKMNKEPDGLYTIPCEINGLRLRFIFDTGASTVSLSLTEATFMLKNGYLETEDILGTTNTMVASGDIHENYLVNLKEVKIGTKIVKNVKAVVKNGLSAPLLLGQSVLSQLGEWSIRNNFLILHDRGGNDFSKYTETDWKQRIEETKKTRADWDADLKYLLPGVVANDYNTILRAGYVLQYTKESTLKDEETVLNKLKELATKGDKEAIFSLGYFYLHKAKSIDDIKKSEEYFNKLIDGKVVFRTTQFYTYETPYHNLYLIYNNKMGQFEKAVNILQKGALLNDADCAIYLFEEYESKKHYQKLYQWASQLSQSCTGIAKYKSIYWKAKCLMEGMGVRKNEAMGIQLLEQIINKYNFNDESALKDLCNYYMFKNNKKIEEFALKIRSKFYSNFYLGCAYYYMKDYASARLHLIHLWDKDKGRYENFKLGFGSCLLGECYENGLGGAISYKDAEKCYMYAYQQCNYFGALGYLGDMYSNEKIYKEPNYEMAFGCYLQGAKNEDAYCCYMASRCYKFGVGTEENLQESEYWLKKAKENGWGE